MANNYFIGLELSQVVANVNSLNSLLTQAKKVFPENEKIKALKRVSLKYVFGKTNFSVSKKKGTTYRSYGIELTATNLNNVFEATVTNFDKKLKLSYACDKNGKNVVSMSSKSLRDLDGKNGAYVLGRNALKECYEYAKKRLACTNFDKQRQQYITVVNARYASVIEVLFPELLEIFPDSSAEGIEYELNKRYEALTIK